MTEIYFDNAATSRPFDEVCGKMLQVMTESYGNPAAQNKMGLDAERIIKEAKETLAGFLSASPDEIFFTSGGTEGNNMALLGGAYAMQKRGKHIISSPAEHPAVLRPLEKLAEEGFEVEYLPVNEKGEVSLEALENAVREDTILVSLMTVNNETGTITDIEEAGRIIKEKNPNTLFHTDAVQGFGKLKINAKKAKADYITSSAHKFHGPKGLGFIYIKNTSQMRPILLGGGQQKGVRPGTENPAGAAAMAEAARLCYKDFDAKTERIFNIKKTLWEYISENIPDTIINGCDLEKASPYVLNVSFLGVRSNVLLNAVGAKGLFASAGSACNSKKKVESHVLNAMGLDHKRTDSALRFSFSSLNTAEEAVKAGEILKEQVEFLRKYAVR